MKNKDFYKAYIEAFLNENAKVNLISANDETYIFEKHICDSLSIEKFFEKYGLCRTLLDIGTGGGFPAVPIALTYPEIEVTALDSIRKKINAIENIKCTLQIPNLQTICSRAENINAKYDVVTARAVASLDKVSGYALPLVKKDGYFITYKSKKAPEELKNAENVLKKHNAQVVDIIEYQLPLNENYTRNLIIIKRD